MFQLRVAFITRVITLKFNQRFHILTEMERYRYAVYRLISYTLKDTQSNIQLLTAVRVDLVIYKYLFFHYT